MSSFQKCAECPSPMACRDRNYCNRLDRELIGTVVGVDKYAEEGKAAKRAPAKTPRPCCLACGKPLRRTQRHREERTGMEWGDYADNAFCGLLCGYRYAVRMVREMRKL